MNLEYIFIDEYRSLKKQGVNLSSKYDIDFDANDNTLEIKENPFYMEGFYSPIIKNLKCIVGENGTGKTTILNYIKEVLTFPVGSYQLEASCILVLIDESADKVLVVNNNVPVKKDLIECPFKNKEVKTLTSYLSKDELIISNTTKGSVLSLISELDKCSILYLSNAFDGRAETDYGPKYDPIAVNLSTNNLTKSRQRESISSYVKEEMLKNLKLTLEAKKFLPNIKYPEEIRISIKHVLTRGPQQFSSTDKKDVVIDNRKRTESIKTKLGNKLSSNPSRANELLYWFYAFLLNEIFEYVPEDKYELLNSMIDESEDVLKCIKEWLNEYYSSFHTWRIIDDKKQCLPESFKWEEYIEKYKGFIAEYLILDELYGKGDKRNYGFDIPLGDETSDTIKDFFNKSEITAEISGINLIDFNWRDLSTGENMYLRLFSNLYFYFEGLTHNEELSGRTLYLLFDEIETYFHPHWQKRLVLALTEFINHFFKSFKVNILLTTHSPFIISDLPKTDLIFLKNYCGEVTIQKGLNDHLQTFGANIHSLLSDSFFLKDGLMGAFANKKINQVINILIDGKLSDISKNREQIEKMINIIGEPAIKLKLLSMFEVRLRSNLLSIKNDIDKLKGKRK